MAPLQKISNAILQHSTHLVHYPDYDRSTLTEGVLHIGVGGFHRAHQARYVHDLIELYGEKAWAIHGVGIMPQDEAISKALQSQDCLYTLLEQSGSSTPSQPETRLATLIGALKNYTWGYKYPEIVFQKLADPAIKMVTLTVTEGGYYLDEGNGTLNINHPAIQHDLTHPHHPQTVFGYLAEGLERRYQAGAAPITILSCDNMQENGHTLKHTLIAFCHIHRPALARWIEHSIYFPNSMVDRITPATTEADRALIRKNYSLDDACPVVCEPFKQWVIEDHFCNDRPPFEKVGVLLTSEVGLYEKMKIRLLNGTHSAMGYLGYLCGYPTIHEIAQASAFIPYLKLLMDNEVTPLIPKVPGIDLTEYKNSLLQRFANPLINDQTLRICMDGSGKIPKYILPSIREQLTQNGPIRQLSLCVASWMRFLNGIDEQGHSIPIIDPQAERLKQAAHSDQHTPHALLGLTDIFGDLRNSQRFVQELSFLLKYLYDKGAHETLEFCKNNPG